MAKQQSPPSSSAETLPDPPPASPLQSPPAPAPAPARRGGYVVTFAGQLPITVAAANKEEAVKEAAKAQGVLSWEKPPDVEEVPS
jgi:hypothetical protein